MSIVDRSSPVPAYFQIASDLERHIEQGRWSAGDRLPSEITLSSEYGVTRMTLRQALAQLEKSAVIELKRGRGAFVLERRMPVVWNLDLTSSAVDLLFRAQGHDLSGQVLSKQVLGSPPRRVMDALDTPGPVLEIERKIFIDHTPTALYRSWFDTVRLPGVERAEGFEGPLAKVFEQNFHVAASRAENEIEVVRATLREANELNARIDTPLVLVTGTSWTESGQPFEHFQVLFAGDRVRFHTTSHS